MKIAGWVKPADDYSPDSKNTLFWWGKISEAIEIRESHPEVNRDGGYNIPTIFVELLSCDNNQVT